MIFVRKVFRPMLMSSVSMLPIWTVPVPSEIVTEALKELDGR